MLNVCKKKMNVCRKWLYLQTFICSFDMSQWETIWPLQALPSTSKASGFCMKDYAWYMVIMHPLCMWYGMMGVLHCKRDKTYMFASCTFFAFCFVLLLLFILVYMYIASDLKRFIVPGHLMYVTGDSDGDGGDDETVKLYSTWTASGGRYLILEI